MDLSKIFLKDACPTSMGGQAVMEGVMMRGENRMAIAIRVPDGRIHIKTQPLGKQTTWNKIPIIRGVVAFVVSLVSGMKTLLYSADVLEAYGAYDDEPNTAGADAEKEYEVKPTAASNVETEWAMPSFLMSDSSDAKTKSASMKEKKDNKKEATSSQNEKGKFELWLEKRLGEKAVWNLMIYLSVVVAIILSVGIFILLPTVVVNLLGKFTENAVLLNLAEGIFRLVIFIIYIVAISRMEDIKTTFQYHGAEHKTIHCFENNLELTPQNARQFYTLHPRCGTSFLMFVMVISLILFSLLGWPNVWVRLLSRIVLIPVVAGLSYELLKWAGRSDNLLVKILSMPGLLLQKLTTREPSDSQLEVAIASIKAVMVDESAPYIEGICDKDAHLIETRHVGKEPKESKEAA